MLAPGTGVSVRVAVGVLVAPTTGVGVRVAVRVWVAVAVFAGSGVLVRVIVGLSVGVEVDPAGGENCKLKRALPAVPLFALTMKKYVVPPVTDSGTRDCGVMKASSLHAPATATSAGQVPVYTDKMVS